MKKIRLLFFLLALLGFPFLSLAQEVEVGVAPFVVQGPQELQYLSQVARDSVQGVFIQQGRKTKAVPTLLNPDALSSSELKKYKSQALVAGRINIVGESYRVLLKWIDENGKSEQAYLQAANLDQFIPELENFTRTRLVPSLSSASVASSSSKSTIPAQPVIPPASTPTKSSPAQTSGVSLAVSSTGSDFKTQSQRLPYEVRAMAYADLDADGEPELLLTSQRDLYLYKLEADGKVREIAKYSGKNLDHFVKVDVLSQWQGEKKNWIVLTNLRGDQAASQILSFENGAFKKIYQNIPYQLRVVSRNGESQLWAEAYRAKGLSSHALFELALEGKSFRPKQKIDLPSDAELYSFSFLSTSGAVGTTQDLVLLNNSGKLKFLKKEAEKFKSLWTSRESYSASANDVAVEVKNAFNQVDADYYIVPIVPKTLNSSSQVELILSKSDTLLDEVVFRKPVVTSGRMVRLKWNGLSFDEIWESKKIDGSIMDYLIVPSASSLKLLVAVRMRDQGLFAGMGPKDSVLLSYDLGF